MVVTVNIPDELAAQAKARGLSLEAYVQEILAEQLARPVQIRQPRTQRRFASGSTLWPNSRTKFLRCLRPFRASGFTRITTKWLLRRVSLQPLLCEAQGMATD